MAYSFFTLMMFWSMEASNGSVELFFQVLRRSSSSPMLWFQGGMVVHWNSWNVFMWLNQTMHQLPFLQKESMLVQWLKDFQALKENFHVLLLLLALTLFLFPVWFPISYPCSRISLVGWCRHVLGARALWLAVCNKDTGELLTTANKVCMERIGTFGRLEWKWWYEINK